MRAGRWELVRPLGRGGMGEVWLARDPDSGEEVALKRLRPGMLDPEHMLRFQRETDALRSLEHPGVLRWIEAGADARGPWFAAELCPGGSLQDLAAGGALPIERAVELARDLAGALSAAHQAGVLHRDVKPSNALLDRAGRVRLADFGLARSTGRGRSLTETGEVMGSPGYLAPEQITGDKELIGPATDVYGLGATLHYLLTGRPPFPARTLVAGLAAVLDKAPTPPSALRTPIPPELDRIVLRCLAKSPAERYTDMQSLLSDLDDLRPAAAGSRGRQVAIAALLVLIAGGLLGWTVAQQLDPGPPRDAPPRPVAAVRRESATTWLEQGLAHFRAERWAEAVVSFDRSLALEPDHLEALAHRGLARASLEDAAGALSDMDRAVALDPRSGMMHWNRAKVLFRAGRLDEALADLDRALALAPSDVQIVEERATVLASLSRWDDALAGFDRVIAAEPSWPRPHYLRALVCESMGRLPQALLSFDRAFELGLGAPWEPVARKRRDAVAIQMRVNEAFARGMQHFEAQRWQSAVFELDGCLELAPGHVLALLHRGLAHLSAGRGQIALNDLDRAVELAPQSGKVRWNRGRVLLDLRRAEEALAEFDRAVELAPDDLQILKDRATMRTTLGRHAEAIPDFDRLIALTPPRGMLHLMRATSHRALGHLEQALADLDRALELGVDAAVLERARASRAALQEQLGR